VADLTPLAGVMELFCFPRLDRSPTDTGSPLLQGVHRCLSVSCVRNRLGDVWSELSFKGRLDSNSACLESITLFVTTGKVVKEANLKFKMWPTPVSPRWSRYVIAVP